MNVIGVLLCGGSSQRMGFNKLTTPLGEFTALERSAESNTLIGIERFARLFACQLLNLILYRRYSCRTADKEHLSQLGS